MYMFRKMTWPKFIILLIVGYIAVFAYSPSTANFVLAVVLVGLIPFLILRSLMLNSIYKSSIDMVDRKFILNNNTLSNDYCTVIYTPDEKIVVMDNISDKKSQKRVFSLTKRNLGINKAWNRLCRIYDSFTTLDSLKAFYAYDASIEVITIDAPKKRTPKKEITIEKSYEEPKIVEMGTIQADPFGVDFGKQNEEGKDFVNIGDIDEKQAFVPKQNKINQKFVDIESIKKQDEYVEKPFQEGEYVDIDSMDKRPEYKEKKFKGQKAVKMNDLVKENVVKINVNAAEASEISLLPGINIVSAKKIIEYRNKNGNFKSVEDFLSVAKVKEHFILKVKEMIEIGEAKDYDPSADDYEKGRIVDL